MLHSPLSTSQGDPSACHCSTACPRLGGPPSTAHQQLQGRRQQRPQAPLCSPLLLHVATPHRAAAARKVTVNYATLQQNNVKDLGREMLAFLSCWSAHSRWFFARAGLAATPTAGEFRQGPEQRSSPGVCCPCTHLAFLQDVLQQRQVLPCEVPKRLYIPALNEGYQVEVVQLRTETQDADEADNRTSSRGLSTLALTHQHELSTLCHNTDTHVCSLPAVLFNHCLSWVESRLRTPV